LRPDCRIVRFTLRELNFFAEAANLVTNKNLGGGVLLVVVPDLHSDEFFLLTCALKWWIFLYLFYHEFARIYGPSQILQKYTYAAVAYGVRDITPWREAAGVASSGLLALTPRATALRP
jgi:hypothetical protein